MEHLARYFYYWHLTYVSIAMFVTMGGGKLEEIRKPEIWTPEAFLKETKVGTSVTAVQKTGSIREKTQLLTKYTGEERTHKGIIDHQGGRKHTAVRSSEMRDMRSYQNKTENQTEMWKHKHDL